MITFNKTLLATIIKVPYDIWKQNCLYVFILNLPYILVVLTFGIIMAIFIDLCFFGMNS